MSVSGLVEQMLLYVSVGSVHPIHTREESIPKYNIVGYRGLIKVHNHIVQFMSKSTLFSICWTE